jgi:REP element-mobilizing transposase RayT
MSEVKRMPLSGRPTVGIGYTASITHEPQAVSWQSVAHQKPSLPLMRHLSLPQREQQPCAASSPIERGQAFPPAGRPPQLTFSCYRRMKLLTNNAWRAMLSQSIDEACQAVGCRLAAFVYMPEHVHLLVWGIQRKEQVSELLSRVKQPVRTMLPKDLKAATGRRTPKRRDRETAPNVSGDPRRTKAGSGDPRRTSGGGWEARAERLVPRRTLADRFSPRPGPRQRPPSSRPMPAAGCLAVAASTKTLLAC